MRAVKQPSHCTQRGTHNMLDPRPYGGNVVPPRRKLLEHGPQGTFRARRALVWVMRMLKRWAVLVDTVVGQVTVYAARTAARERRKGLAADARKALPAEKQAPWLE